MWIKYDNQKLTGGTQVRLARYGKPQKTDIVADCGSGFINTFRNEVSYIDIPQIQEQGELFDAKT